MVTKRSISCDTEGCGKIMIEEEPGSGFPGWGGVQGMLKDGHEAHLCPEHLKAVVDFLDRGGKL